jgi:hypothetical protein
MSRFSLLVVLFLLGLTALAQVVVTNGGYATQAGPAIPATPVSPPVLYAPIVHLESGHVPAANATTTTNGVIAPVEPAVVVPAPIEQQEVSSAAPQETFRFGAAQFHSYSAFPGTGDNLGPGSNLSLAEAARIQRQREKHVSAHLYTNEDIEHLNQANGTINVPSGRGTLANSNWSPANGVINFNATPPQNSVSAPPQQNPPTPGTTAAPPSHPEGIPEAETAPPAQRPVELAQNTPQAAQAPHPEPFKSESPAANKSSASMLPHAASRLPMLGFAGLVSITMGLFVRYQRSKAR